MESYYKILTEAFDEDWFTVVRIDIGDSDHTELYTKIATYDSYSDAEQAVEVLKSDAELTEAQELIVMMYNVLIDCRKGQFRPISQKTSNVIDSAWIYIEEKKLKGAKI